MGINSASDKLVDWINSGGNDAAEPDITYSTGPGPQSSSTIKTGKLPWTKNDYLFSFFSGIEDENIGEVTIDFVRTLGKVIEREAGYIFDINVDSSGTVIAQNLKIDTAQGRAVAFGNSSFGWDALWTNATDIEKAKLIYEYYLEAVHLGAGGRIDASAVYASHVDDTDNKKLKTTIRRKKPYVISRGVGTSLSYDEDFIVGFSFARRVNQVFFTNNFFIVNMQNEEAVKEETAAEAARRQVSVNQAVQELAAANLLQAGGLADLSTRPAEGSEEDTEQRKEFFKKIEQCILLNVVDKLGDYRKEIRTAAIRGETRFPYGGRVICVDAEQNMYSNYANSDGEAFHYSANFLQKFLDKIDYNFIISKFVTVELEQGPTEIEMPLLFEGGENFLYNDELPSYSGTKIFTTDPDSTKDLTTKKILRMQPGRINDNIKFDDISIKFHGENQATAKTNVDVDLTISMPNLLMFQSQFRAKTFYIDDSGEKKPYTYDYSLIDLITYLHRSDLGDVFKDLSTNGARLFTPKFFRNYNRLVMKIIPYAPATIPNLSAAEKTIYDRIVKHLENIPLVLDLSLIDHTISKEEENSNAKIKISYKGYIKSFLQDPKFDLIRKPDEIQREINLERDFIDTLKDQKSDRIALDLIDGHNKAVREETEERVTSITILNRLILRKKMFVLTVNSDTFRNAVTKDYVLTSLNTIWDSTSDTNITTVQAQITGSIGDEIEGNLEANKDYKLKFFYLGDLIDVAMDNFYYYQPSEKSDFMREDARSFPFKVILPTFHPMTQDADVNGNKIRKRRETAGGKLSIADFPISYEWFMDWYIAEFIDSEVQFYTIGTFINKIINNIFNGFMIEDCYLQGSYERIQFAVRSDFGLFDKKSTQENNIAKQQSATWLEYRMTQDTVNTNSFVNLDKSDAPFFKKDPKLPRSEHCNFLYVYPQIAMFSDYKGIETNVIGWDKHNIPYIARQLKTNLINQQSVYTESISFEKEEANYRRESRFQAENLYTLAQLASVYNCTAKVRPTLDIFPGMLIWVNAGLYQEASVRNSIANLLGMGGYHLIESVTHTAKIDGSLLSDFKTSIQANWISNGSIKLEGETPEEQEVTVVTVDGPAEDVDNSNSGTPEIMEIIVVDAETSDTVSLLWNDAGSKEYGKRNFYWLIVQNTEGINKVEWQEEGKTEWIALKKYKSGKTRTAWGIKVNNKPDGFATRKGKYRINGGGE